MKSKSGRRIILQLLHPNQQKYVPLHLQHMAHPPPKPASGFEILEDQVYQSSKQVTQQAAADECWCLHCCMQCAALYILLVTSLIMLQAHHVLHLIALKFVCCVV